MTVAVKNTGEMLTKLLPACYIESRARMGRQINVRHQLKVITPVVCVCADCVYLLDCLNQIRVIKLSGTAPYFTSATQPNKQKASNTSNGVVDLPLCLRGPEGSKGLLKLAPLKKCGDRRQGLFN